MLRFRLVALLFAGCCLGSALAQDIRVLKVELPPIFNANHKSTESLSLQLSEGYDKRQKVYMRVFYDDKTTLKKLASYAGPKQCTRYTHFVRLEVDPTDGVSLSQVLAIFRSTPAMNAEYTVVFEQGEEAPGMENVILLDKVGADRYFANALPLNLVADGVDAQNKRITAPKAPRASFWESVEAFFVPPVMAANPAAAAVAAPPKVELVNAPHCMAIEQEPTVVKPVYEIGGMRAAGGGDALASLGPGGLTLHARGCKG